MSENNSIEKLNEALNVEDDTIGFEYTPEEAELDALEIARMDDMEDDYKDKMSVALSSMDTERMTWTLWTTIGRK